MKWNESIVCFILRSCAWCHLPLSMLLTTKHTDKMAIGQRCWFKAPFISVALVWVSLLTFCRHCYTKYCIFHIEHLQIVSSTIMHAIDHTTCRQVGRVVFGAGLRHQSLQWRGFVSHSCYFVEIPIQSIVSCILNTCTWYLLPSSMPFTTQHTGRMAGWSKWLG